LKISLRHFAHSSPKFNRGGGKNCAVLAGFSTQSPLILSGIEREKHVADLKHGASIIDLRSNSDTLSTPSLIFTRKSKSEKIGLNLTFEPL